MSRGWRLAGLWVASLLAVGAVAHQAGLARGRAQAARAFLPRAIFVSDAIRVYDSAADITYVEPLRLTTTMWVARRDHHGVTRYDDVRIYGYGLTHDEMLTIAGRPP